MRILFFIVLILVALYTPLWVFSILAIIYACIYVPYELVILGLCIDAGFGYTTFGLWYTACTLSIAVSTELLKPYLRLNTV